MSGRKLNLTQTISLPPINTNNSKLHNSQDYKKVNNNNSCDETKTTLNLNSNKDYLEKLSEYIYANVIGNRKDIFTPYGHRQIIYCDHIASGRSIEFIENFLKAKVFPFYGNTHTTTSICSNQTTRFRNP